MFGELTNSISKVISGIRGKKRLSESQLKESVEKIEEALLKSDVNLEVAREFSKSVLERAVGQELIEGVAADEQFVAIVHDELVKMIGAEDEAKVNLLEKEKTSVVLLFGLQGSGKTTTAGKLAKYYKDERRVMLVGLDVHRPAAMDQLQVLADKVGVRCHIDKKEKKAHKILKKALFHAKKESMNLVIVDTAGRLEIDKTMMEELKRVNNMANPCERLLVVDSTIGQSVFDVAKSFKENVGISGVILTKFDSDSKGGAALSLRYATETFIKFVGTGEHIDDIDEFNAERVAGRMLGMGDIVKLVKKAQSAMDEKKAEEMMKRVIENNFDYNDFLTQIDTMNSMGGLDDIASMLPGGQGLANADLSKEEKKLSRYKAIIQSMTKKERLSLFPLNNSRKMRIAKGSGTSIFDVNQLLKQFNQMKNMMGSKKKMDKMMKQVEQMGIDPGELQKMMK